tara:strand:- start:12 stop:662 length:651 start_codon:yes stop_codon:yes gene_type:complete
MNAPSDTSVIKELAQYHPLIIEGMGGYDPRDPEPIALQIASQLRDRWQAQPSGKPVILITQGDPIEERGISAITRRVAGELDIHRAMAFLEPEIADYHKPNADHHGVVLEIPYSALKRVLESEGTGVVRSLEQSIDSALAEKNQQRDTERKSTLESYYRDFALLQEVTKAACNRICGDLTVAHTSAEISPFSVTSFYKVGLNLGLVGADQIVAYES